jgi:hypothetical protein
VSGSCMHARGASNEGRLGQFGGATVSTCLMGLEQRRDGEPKGEPVLWETLIRQDGRARVDRTAPNTESPSAGTSTFSRC